MARTSEVSVDRPRRRVSGRGLLIVLGGIFLFVLVFGRAIARFYVDYLWHEALGREDVFWGVLTAKLTLFFAFFAIFAVIAGINLWIADRVAPDSFPANVHPYVERFHEVFGHRLRLVRYAFALVFALLLALPAVALWQDWLLFRNAREFGIADAQFGADVGFYIFQLPFLSFLLNWLFASLIVVLFLTAAAHILNGGVVFVSPMPVVRQATKAHVAVLLAVLAVVKAGDYWLDRYAITNTERGIVQGATYSVVKAQLPAIMLLILIALLTAGLYMSVVKTGSFRLPLHRVRTVARRGDRRWTDLSRGRAGARRQPEPGGPRAALHRTQRDRHQTGVGDHRGRAAHRLVRAARRQRGREQPGTAREHPSAQPERDAEPVPHRPW